MNMSVESLEVSLSNLSDFVEANMYIPSLLSTFLNVFHLIVLLQKSIIPSAVTSLLIAIAVVDIFSPIFYIKMGLRAQIFNGVCVPSRGYSETLFNWILLALRDDFRRCSTWFGLDLAVIRMFAIKLAMKKYFKFIIEAPFGLKVILGTSAISTSVSIFYLFRYQIVPDDSWRPVIGCPEFVVQYIVDEIDGSGNAREVHLLVTAIFEKIIPSFLFPIVAAVLIYELRKASKISQVINQSGTSTVLKINEKTNKLVVYMTITFIIIEFPIGICKLITATHDSYEESILTESIAKLLNMIYVPVTATHCIICFTMSSQYRNTVKRLLNPEKKKATVKKNSVRAATLTGVI